MAMLGGQEEARGQGTGQGAGSTHFPVACILDRTVVHRSALLYSSQFHAVDTTCHFTGWPRIDFWKLSLMSGCG